MKKNLVTAAWLLAAVVTAALVASADEEPPRSEAAGKPPSIVYGGSRRSTTWLGKPGAPQVAVDEGVTWQGVTVYLSLTWDLVGVDAKTNAVLYVQHVGAFWNALGFKEVPSDRGAGTRWAVELRPGPGAREGAERRRVHDLRTGQKLAVPDGVVTPSGTPFKPRAHGSGDESRVAEPFHLITSTPANWAAVQERLFGGVDPTRVGAVDFDREVVYVASLGNSWNARGIIARGAYEDGKRILLRIDRNSFQTINGGMKARPWGIFVLPRRAGKAYVVERDTQNLIGGPSIWKEVFRVSGLGPAEDELRALPERAALPHHGWEKNDEPPPRLPPPPPPKRPR